MPGEQTPAPEEEKEADPDPIFKAPATAQLIVIGDADFIRDFLAQHCFDCHSGDSPEGSATDDNLKWTARLGSNAYGNPTIAGGKVYVGTDTLTLRDDPRRVPVPFVAADETVEVRDLEPVFHVDRERVPHGTPSA